MKFSLPYDHKTIDIDIEDSKVAAVLASKIDTYQPKGSEEELVEAAMDNPIGSPKLEELVKGKKNIVMIASDHTRPVPSKLLTPILLRRIRSTAPDAQVTILIATGTHVGSTPEQLKAKFGEDIIAHEKIVMHDCRNEGAMVRIGTLPSGGECSINKLAVEADLLIAQGFIEAHDFAGFSGGRKSVLPGVSSQKTIMTNHCSEFLSSPQARPGGLDGNPLHTDMLYAAEQAKLAFILNVVLNGKRTVLGAFAGHHEKAHRAGCDFLSSLSTMKKVVSPITISTNGGYPMDLNVYQSFKGMGTGATNNEKGGVLIMIAGLRDGVGGDDLYEAFCKSASPQALLDSILHVGRQETTQDQWAVQKLARVLVEHQVIIVSDIIDPNIITSMKMQIVKTLDEALKIAREIKGQDAKITVVPNGLSIIPAE